MTYEPAFPPGTRARACLVPSGWALSCGTVASGPAAAWPLRVPSVNFAIVNASLLPIQPCPRIAKCLQWVESGPKRLVSALGGKRTFSGGRRDMRDGWDYRAQH